MLQLCYASRATVPFDGATLTSLLQKSRENNHRRGVSGLLVYQYGSFLQLIEGADPIVIELYNKIRRDPRHTDVSLLFKEKIEQRSFEQWSMGFVDAANPELSGMPGYADLFTKQFQQTEFRRDGERARLVFLQFKDGLWHRPVNVAGAVRLGARVGV
ncbi:MAG: BLUF domain-containing protein [Phycisphaerae bacterium]